MWYLTIGNEELSLKVQKGDQMNRKTIGVGKKSIIGEVKKITPVSEMPTKIGCASTCRMPDPWVSKRNKRHGIAGILDDIKVY